MVRESFGYAPGDTAKITPGIGSLARVGWSGSRLATHPGIPICSLRLLVTHQATPKGSDIITARTTVATPIMKVPFFHISNLVAKRPVDGLTHSNMQPPFQAEKRANHPIRSPLPADFSDRRRIRCRRPELFSGPATATMTNRVTGRDNCRFARATEMR